MAILSSVAYIGISEIRQTVRDNKRRADLHKLARALELFKADHGQYPPNNYYSAQEYSGVDWSTDADETMLPVLVEGGDLDLVYRTSTGLVTRNVTVQGGYLDDYIEDPINDINGWTSDSDAEPINHHHVYLYWGPIYLIFDTSDWPPMTWDVACPEPPPDTCSGWDTCCNNGGCLDAYCDYIHPTLYWIADSTNSFSKWCYGVDSDRTLVLLAADLENESRPEERIDNVLSFCPTQESDPDMFFNFKRYFFRGKDCYEGPDGAIPGGTGAGCDDGGTGWSPWGGNRHNYFVPLTGEYDLN
jgi:hypothetical protein